MLQRRIEEVKKQKSQEIDENRLEHRLHFIQKNFPKKGSFCFKKRNIFFTDSSKIKQLFYLCLPQRVPQKKIEKLFHNYNVKIQSPN